MKNFNIKTRTYLKLTVFLLIIGFSFSCQQKEPWKNMFSESDLTGWNQKNGEADYKVENGTIVGSTVISTPNSFLCTNEHYSDFILELEYKVDSPLNSGIQIRSNSFEDFNNGRVHGYQVEIDPSDRGWSAGIYDEARRGWLYDLSENEPASKAFKNGEWNHYRIEALGDSIKTWINDVPAAFLVDSKTNSGFIALQVHGIGRDSTKLGLEVVWKNVRIITEEPQKYARYSPLKPKIIEQ